MWTLQLFAEARSHCPHVLSVHYQPAQALAVAFECCLPAQSRPEPLPLSQHPVVSNEPIGTQSQFLQLYKAINDELRRRRQERAPGETSGCCCCYVWWCVPSSPRLSKAREALNFTRSSCCILRKVNSLCYGRLRSRFMPARAVSRSPSLLQGSTTPNPALLLPAVLVMPFVEIIQQVSAGGVSGLWGGQGCSSPPPLAGW